MSVKIEGIVLAAGLSRRAGSFKMELPLGGKPLLTYAVESMLGACDRVLVVTGWQQERVMPLLRSYTRAQAVFNEGFRLGMFSSVQKGIRYLDRRGGLGFFIMPGDYPFIPAQVYRQLLEAQQTGGDGYDVFIPTHNDRRGHPILLRWSMAAEILKEPVDSSLRRLIKRHRVLTVPVTAEGILRDVDTPEDYRNVEQELKGF